jgi:hypothetical protein
VIAALALVAVLGVGVGLLVGLSGDSTPRPARVAGTAAATGTGAVSSSGHGGQGTSSATGGAVSIPDARALVVRYLDDINRLDRTSAQQLICTPLVDGWKATIDQPGGDFTISVDQATFQRATAHPGGLDVTYSLAVTDRSTGGQSTNQVTFTVLPDAAGQLQLCGEAS